MRDRHIIRRAIGATISTIVVAVVIVVPGVARTDDLPTWVVTLPDGGIPAGSGCGPWSPAVEPDQFAQPGSGPDDHPAIRPGRDGIVDIVHWRDCDDRRDGVWVPMLDPEQLAEEARRHLAETELMRPIPITSPPRRTIVNLATWLAVSTTVRATATAARPGVSSTTTAELTRTTFSFDEQDLVTCAGIGSIWSPATSETEPDCAHVFSATGSDVVTATSTWAVTWTSTDATGGALEPIILSGSIALIVSEIQTIGIL